ncbi:MAG: F0F1 ATP synthase subunit A [Clostridia bacterium]|nr:F0F1 ATP synthase subunit A [Clostridia bacterium]
MTKKQFRIRFIVFLSVIALLLAGIILAGDTGGEGETVKEVMRDAVLHDSVKVDFFGLRVNPGLISAYTVTGILLVAAVILRIFAVPRFREIPGKLQSVLEMAVGLFDGMAKEKSPHRNRFLSAYIFTAGAYIFVGTLFELLGFQVVSASGLSVSMPAPLADINGAISLGVMSYSVILMGGLIAAGPKGFFTALKDFSLPVSMSFRLFGALLSGALVTELVYYYFALSFVLPVIVGVLFTLIHAVIQAYVLTMLTAQFYGESTEKKPKKAKSKG